MKNFKLSTFVAVLLIILYTSSCKKIEAIKRHNTINETCCRVETVTFPDGFQQHTLTAHFDYNLIGDPNSIQFEKSTVPGIFFGYFNMYFEYDLLNRLSIIRSADPNTDKTIKVEYLHYIDEHTMIDSTFVPDGSGSTMGLKYGSHEIFTLDNSGRVAVEDFQIPDWNIVNNYHYNGDGNLVLHPGKTEHYDDKVNINRTNKVWKFLDRDYSNNNTLETVTGQYNEFGLPTTLLPKPHVYEFFDYPGFARLVTRWPMQIQYSCDSTKSLFK